MNKALLAGLTLAGLVVTTADAAEPSLCARLAANARYLSAAAWDKPQPMARWLQASRSWQKATRESPVVKALKTDPLWSSRVDAPDGQADVDHLVGTPVYLVERISGTAHCQQVVLVEARAGKPARELKPPFELGVACMGGYAQFARVMGRPALVVETEGVNGRDRAYRIAPWTSQGWGATCQLALRMHTFLKLMRKFCAPGSPLCEKGESVALQLAQASELDMAYSAPFNVTRFAQGHEPDASLLAALNPPLREPGAVGDINLPLPTFGNRDPIDGMSAQFSNASGMRLPVFIDNQWWIAVVGRGGVGWRVGSTVLVALFSPPGRATDAVASYQFVIQQAGLRDAVARDEAAMDKRGP